MRPLWITILLACDVVVGSAASAAVRVALISTGPEKQTSSLMALAEAKLSADSRIELLDRTSIRRVLEEQKLSLSGLVDAEHAVAAGKLLRVEMFAFVQTLDEENPPVLTVFDAFNGARLVDVDLPGAAGGGGAQADAIA